MNLCTSRLWKTAITMKPNISIKSQILTFRRLGLKLVGGESNPSVTNYETWQQQIIQKRLRLLIWLLLPLSFSFLVYDLSSFLVTGTPYSAWWLLIDITQISSLLICLIILAKTFSYRTLDLLFLSISWSTTLIPQFLDTFSGINLVRSHAVSAWTVNFFTQATVMPFRWFIHLTSQVVSLSYYFGINGILERDLFNPGVSVGEGTITLFWVCLICNISVYLYERLAKAEFHARRQLEAEQEKSERLLLNILPQSIAERLKQSHRTIADNFTEVTVLFADIVGFTELSAQISPPEVVELLNQIFSIFDQLAEEHQLEKIKTIGDAYMVVAGLPEPYPDHAAAIANMALDMQQALTKFNHKTGKNLDIRMGIHTGPVVAGVIGLKKFAYDLWGDTVNTASRMESHGIPGQIQVTPETYEYLKEQYLFQARGLIPIKGKGEMNTYLLVGKRV